MISVVIPAFNEERSIIETVRNVRAVLDGAEMKDAEILIVDDGSSDATGALALQAGAVVVVNPHNAGYGYSLKAGITKARFDTIVITDADGTYPIEKIPELVKLYQDGFDMVVGARSGAHYRGSRIKWPMRRLLRFLVEWTTGRRIPDINSGLRVFSRATIMEYFSHLCNTFSFTTSLTLAYMMTSKFVTYVTIPYAERVGKSKVNLWRDSFRTVTSQKSLEAA